MCKSTWVCVLSPSPIGSLRKTTSLSFEKQRRGEKIVYMSPKGKNFQCALTSNSPFVPRWPQRTAGVGVSSVNKGTAAVRTHTRQRVVFHPRCKRASAAEAARGGLKSQLRSPVQSQGSPAFQSPVLKAASVLKGGSDVLCSSAPAAQRAARQPGPCAPPGSAAAPRSPAQPHRGAGLWAVAKQEARAWPARMALRRTAHANEFRHGWLVPVASLPTGLWGTRLRFQFCF